mgnify:CR=1 FL=1
MEDTTATQLRVVLEKGDHEAAIIKELQKRKLITPK